MRAVTLVLLALGAATPARTERIGFDSDKPGSLPAGWTSAVTHTGGAPKWEVLADATAPSKPHVLAQTSSDRTAGRFPLAIYDRMSLQDGEVAVKFKTVAGSVDQAAGIVWRFRDPDNYYIVRANALEDNLVLYKVEGGKRISLAPKGTPSRTYGVKHKVPKQTWTSLRVSFSGDRFVVSFDGQSIMEVEDSTFPGAGKAGLWTKADSVTYFDDFEAVRK